MNEDEKREDLVKHLETLACGSSDPQPETDAALEIFDELKNEVKHWRRKWSEAEARAAGLKEERDEFCETVKQRTKEYEEEIIRIMRERCACEFKDHELVELCKYHGDRERTLREERDLVIEGSAEFEEECNTLRYRVKALDDDASKLSREIGTMQEHKIKLRKERDVAREALAKSRALIQQLNDRLEEARELYAYEYETNNLATELADAVDKFRTEAAGRKSETLKEGQLWVEISVALAAFRARKPGPVKGLVLTIPADLVEAREVFKMIREASACPEGEDLLEHVASIRTRLELTDDLIPHLESINWREVFMGGRMFKRELVLTPEQKKKLDEDLAAYHLNEPNPHHFGPVNPVSDVRVDGKPAGGYIVTGPDGPKVKKALEEISELADEPNPHHFAKGGVLKDPGITLVGEDRHDDFIPLAGKMESTPGTAEPEAVVPLPNGKSIPVNIDHDDVTQVMVPDVGMHGPYSREQAERERRIRLGMEVPGGITGDAELEAQFSHPDHVELEGENILVKPAGDDPDVLVVPIKFPSGTATPSEGETVQCAVCGIMFYTELVITMDDVGGPVCSRCQDPEAEAEADARVEDDLEEQE